MEKRKLFYTYIALCADGTLYTGYTDDVQKRLITHNKGQGAKYTRGRLPIEIAFVSDGISKKDAQSLEKKIKRMPRKKKLLIIEDREINKCTKQISCPHQ